MKISGSKLAEGRIQCWAWWVGLLRKRCWRGFFGVFYENHWNWELIVLDHRYELWEYKLSRAVWEVLFGTFLLEGWWWPKEKTSISAGEIPQDRLFQDQWRMRSRSRICEMPSDLLGIFVFHIRMTWQQMVSSKFLILSMSFQPPASWNSLLFQPHRHYSRLPLREVAIKSSAPWVIYISFTAHFCWSLDAQEYIPPLPCLCSVIVVSLCLPDFGLSCGKSSHENSCKQDVL